VSKDIIHGDRRRQRRYAIELDVEYKILHAGRVVSRGGGKTVNISSGGLLFSSEDGWADGPSVELSIRWPALLGDAPFIELCASGRLVRLGAEGAAVRITRHYFQRLANLNTAIDDLCGKILIQ
jgi:c-di-GMP-binding flagellar brake protein YcgR